MDLDLHEKSYLGMCKQVLWPAFHNVDLLDLSTSSYGNRDNWTVRDDGDEEEKKVSSTFLPAAPLLFEPFKPQ